MISNKGKVSVVTKTCINGGAADGQASRKVQYRDNLTQQFTTSPVDAEGDPNQPIVGCPLG